MYTFQLLLCLIEIWFLHILFIRSRNTLRKLRCVIFSRQYCWFKRKCVTSPTRSCRHVFFALASSSRATFTPSQSYSTSLCCHANSHDSRLFEGGKNFSKSQNKQHAFLLHNYTKHTKCLFYLTRTETYIIPECELKIMLKMLGYASITSDQRNLYKFI